MKHITLSINGQDITGFKKPQCVYRLLIAVISRLWVSTTCSCLSNGVYIYMLLSEIKLSRLYIVIKTNKQTNKHSIMTI